LTKLKPDIEKPDHFFAAILLRICVCVCVCFCESIIWYPDHLITTKKSSSVLQMVAILVSSFPMYSIGP
jgi:hypothetical protein